jgi:hypothetical protein
MVASVSVLADRRRLHEVLSSDEPITEWFNSPQELGDVEGGSWVVVHPRGHRHAIHGVIGTMHPSTSVDGDLFFLLGTHRGIESFRLSQIVRARRADPPGVGDCVVRLGVPERLWRGVIVSVTRDGRAFCRVNGGGREAVDRVMLRVVMLAED